MKGKVGEKYLPSCVIQTIKQPTSVMIWSAVCGKEMGRLYIVKGMSQVQYKKLLLQQGDWFCPGEKKSLGKMGQHAIRYELIKKFLFEIFHC